jgi:hypothetical protein
MNTEGPVVAIRTSGPDLFQTEGGSKVGRRISTPNQVQGLSLAQAIHFLEHPAAVTEFVDPGLSQKVWRRVDRLAAEAHSADPPPLAWQAHEARLRGRRPVNVLDGVEQIVTFVHSGVGIPTTPPPPSV